MRKVRKGAKFQGCRAEANTHSPLSPWKHQEGRAPAARGNKASKTTKGKLTKQETGRRLCFFQPVTGGLKRHAEDIRPHTLCIPLELGSWVVPVFGPESLSGVRWKYSELLVMKLHGVQDGRSN